MSHCIYSLISVIAFIRYQSYYFIDNEIIQIQCHEKFCADNKNYYFLLYSFVIYVDNK